MRKCWTQPTITNFRKFRAALKLYFNFATTSPPCIFSLTLPLQRLQQLFSNIILFIAEQTKTKFSTKRGGKKGKKRKKFSNFNKRWILLKFYAMFWFPVCRYLCYLSTAFLAATQCRNTREKMHGDNFTAFYIKRDLLSWPGIKKQLC